MDLKKGNTVLQSLCKNFIHLIFSTKNRNPFLKDHIRSEMHTFLGGILRNWDSPSLIIGGVEDHVHILFIANQEAHHRKVSF